jgi:hypothetical protein
MDVRRSRSGAWTVGWVQTRSEEGLLSESRDANDVERRKTRHRSDPLIPITVAVPRSWRLPSPTSQHSLVGVSSLVAFTTRPDCDQLEAQSISSNLRSAAPWHWAGESVASPTKLLLPAAALLYCLHRLTTASGPTSVGSKCTVFGLPPAKSSEFVPPYTDRYRSHRLLVPAISLPLQPPNVRRFFSSPTYVFLIQSECMLCCLFFLSKPRPTPRPP